MLHVAFIPLLFISEQTDFQETWCESYKRQTYCHTSHLPIILDNNAAMSELVRRKRH